MVIHLFALLLLPYLTLGEHVRQTFQTYICPRLIEFFLSLFCSPTSPKKIEGRSGHILRLLRTEQSSFFLFLSFLLFIYERNKK
jgi:hypothetical protein